jgi:hypothetical protein
MWFRRRRMRCWVCGEDATDSWTWEVWTCSRLCADFFAFCLMEGIVEAVPA